MIVRKGKRDVRAREKTVVPKSGRDLQTGDRGEGEFVSSSPTDYDLLEGERGGYLGVEWRKVSTLETQRGEQAPDFQPGNSKKSRVGTMRQASG